MYGYISWISFSYYIAFKAPLVNETQDETLKRTDTPSGTTNWREMKKW